MHDAVEAFGEVHGVGFGTTTPLWGLSTRPVYSRSSRPIGWYRADVI